MALRVLEELGLDGEIPVAALAKQFEEVYLPGRADPLRIPRTSEALYLLQQIRDEAHRFAITYHRKLRGKRMTVSVLDDVPGLGPARRKRLLRELGGVNAVRGRSPENAEGLPWLPERVADAMYAKLHGPAAAARADARRGRGGGGEECGGGREGSRMERAAEQAEVEGRADLPEPEGATEPGRRERSRRDEDEDRGDSAAGLVAAPMSAPLLPHGPEPDRCPSRRQQLWEVNTAWWQESFTGGADAEYRSRSSRWLVDHLSGRGQRPRHRMRRGPALPSWRPACRASAG